MAADEDDAGIVAITMVTGHGYDDDDDDSDGDALLQRIVLAE